MSEDNLRTLLRDEVLADEPAFTLSSDAAKRQGRRSRTARRGLAAALVVAVVGAGTAGVMSLRGDPDSSLDAEIAEALANYDANAMPGNIRTAAQLAAEGTPAFASEEIGAFDDQGNEIDQPDWDKASGWSGHFTWTPTHSLSISVSHSKSESEGNAQRYCEEGTRRRLLPGLRRGDDPGGCAGHLQDHRTQEDGRRYGLESRLQP